MNLIGSIVSLIQQDESRLEAVLQSINQEAATLTLSDVVLFGTEDRPTSKFIPYIDQKFPSITLQRHQIKAISKLTTRSEAPVETTPATTTPATTTPAVNNDNNKNNDNNNNNNNNNNNKSPTDFNTTALSIERDGPVKKSYDPSEGFFDSSSDHHSVPTYSNLDTFGQKLAGRQARRWNPDYNPHNRHGYNNHRGGYNNNNNNRDSGYNNRNSGSGNRDSGYNNRNSGSGNRDSGYNNRNAGSGNRDSGYNNRDTSHNNKNTSSSRNNDYGGYNRNSTNNNSSRNKP